jgi:hypothetical protein
MNNETSDIYSGKYVSCWKDDDGIYLSFPGVTVELCDDCFDEVKKELKELVGHKDFENTAVFEELNEILKIKDDKKDLLIPRDLIEKYAKYCVDENLSIIPSEKWVDFFDNVFTEVLYNETVVDSILLAFKAGLIFQKHRDDFES